MAKKKHQSVNMFMLNDPLMGHTDLLDINSLILECQWYHQSTDYPNTYHIFFSTKFVVLPNLTFAIISKNMFHNVKIFTLIASHYLIAKLFNSLAFS